MSDNKNKKVVPVNFHRITVEQCMDVINENLNVQVIGFFTPMALAYIESVMHVLKAYSKTPNGVDYLDFGAADSFGALILHCNNYRALSRITSEVEAHVNAGSKLKKAIELIKVDYMNLERSPETADAVRLHINAILTRIDRNAWRTRKYKAAS